MSSIFAGPLPTWSRFQAAKSQQRPHASHEFPSNATECRSTAVTGPHDRASQEDQLWENVLRKTPDSPVSQKSKEPPIAPGRQCGTSGVRKHHSHSGVMRSPEERLHVNNVARLCETFILNVFSTPIDWAWDWNLALDREEQQRRDENGATDATFAKHTPRLAYFVAYAIYRTRLSLRVIYQGLLLLRRLKQRWPLACGTSGHRLFVASTLVASKGPSSDSDEACSNASWAIVCKGMYDLQEINTMEREFLGHIEHTVRIGLEELDDFVGDLHAGTFGSCVEVSTFEPSAHSAALQTQAPFRLAPAALDRGLSVIRATIQHLADSSSRAEIHPSSGMLEAARICAQAAKARQLKQTSSQNIAAAWRQGCVQSQIHYQHDSGRKASDAVHWMTPAAVDDAMTSFLPPHGNDNAQLLYSASDSDHGREGHHASALAWQANEEPITVGPLPGNRVPISSGMSLPSLSCSSAAAYEDHVPCDESAAPQFTHFDTATGPRDGYSPYSRGTGPLTSSDTFERYPSAGSTSPINDSSPGGTQGHSRSASVTTWASTPEAEYVNRGVHWLADARQDLAGRLTRHDDSASDTSSLSRSRTELVESMDTYSEVASDGSSGSDSSWAGFESSPATSPPASGEAQSTVARMSAGNVIPDHREVINGSQSPRADDGGQGQGAASQKTQTLHTTFAYEEQHSEVIASLQKGPYDQLRPSPCGGSAWPRCRRKSF